MAALTAQTQRRTRPAGFGWQQTWRQANTVVVYIGSFCGIPGAASFTSTRGYARAWTDADQLIWIGPCIGFNFPESVADIRTGAQTGDTTATPVPEIITEAGSFVLEQYAVTGVSAQADVRLSVYASTDNDLTVTAPPNGGDPIGRIVYWYSSTTADVFIYGFGLQVVEVQ